jgi:hypothetical protein
MAMEYIQQNVYFVRPNTPPKKAKRILIQLKGARVADQAVILTAFLIALK